MSRRPRVWPVLLAAAAGLVILLGLGTWQVQRLAWKEALLAQLAANAAAAPVDLATAAARAAEGGNAEFLKLQFRATYLPDRSMALISTFDRGPGWTIITPAITGDGRLVLVDRGRVPAGRQTDVPPPAGEVELTGILRRHNGHRGYFDPDNDPASATWYWWDVPAMIAAAKPAADVEAVPFVVQLVRVPGDTTLPQPDEPRATLRNNHLGYAITWFGLAAALVVVTAAYLRTQMKKSAA